MTESKTKTFALAIWLKKNQIWWNEDLLELAAYGVSGGCGVLSRCAIPAGEVIARIPKDRVLSVRTTKISRLLEEENLEDDVALNLAIMYERARKDKSPFYGYLQTLPEGEFLPHLWTDQVALAALVGTELEEHVKIFRKQLIREFATQIEPLLCRKELSSIAGIDSEAYIFAATLSCSRAFFVDEWHREALVPFMDLFNHKCQRLPDDACVEGQGESKQIYTFMYINPYICRKGTPSHIPPALANEGAESTLPSRPGAAGTPCRSVCTWSSRRRWR
jgi:hypothetical protein